MSEQNKSAVEIINDYRAELEKEFKEISDNWVLSHGNLGARSACDEILKRLGNQSTEQADRSARLDIKGGHIG